MMAEYVRVPDHYEDDGVLTPPPRGGGRGLLAAQAPPSSLDEELESLTLNQPRGRGQGLLASKVAAKAPSSSLDDDRKSLILQPLRPGFGTVGRKCVVMANHFLVEVADKDLHHYHVTISPEVTSKNFCREIISELVKNHRASELADKGPAYDGRKSFYTAGPLPFTSKDFVVMLADKDTKSSFKRSMEYKVSIKFAAKHNMHHLQEFIRGTQLDAPQEAIQVLDVVLRATLSEINVVVGRSLFSPNLAEKGELGNGVEYWKGFYQSLRPTQMGLSLNIDTTAAPFFEPILVSDFVLKYCKKVDTDRPLSDQDWVKIQRALKGVKVELVHTEDRKRHKISNLSIQPMNQLTFARNESQTTVVQYFRDRYKIDLELQFLPALQAGSDAKPVFLPMELSRIIPGQRYTIKLNGMQVTNMLRATCQRPSDREENVIRIVNHNNYNGMKLVNEFGIRVENTNTAIEARVLPPPVLRYFCTRESPRVGVWNMMDKQMVNGAKVEYWAAVSFALSTTLKDLQLFCKDLLVMCRSKGMDINPAGELVPFCIARPSRIEKALLDIHRESEARLAGQPGKHLQLLIVLLPDDMASYGTIKRVCETDLGIVSQCCNPRKALRKDRQYLENVALKINVKAGGRNTILESAIDRRLPYVTDMPTIIFGADVTHPQPGEDSSPSIAAVVASMDWPEVTKYRALVSAQPHRDEIIHDLYKVTQDPQQGKVEGGMVRDLLMAFFKLNGRKPMRIIFYRDGVSDGQFAQVLLYEVDAIRKACLSLQENYMPRITFMVVQKRHRTRLFPVTHNECNNTVRSGNILPGTVIDTKICHPSKFDFFLCSHAGILGTSRPTHYHVLHDENRFTADGLQMLTYHLCYTYAMCTRSVSVVPPVYYAHLAAYRARSYLEGSGVSDNASTICGGCGRGTKEKVAEIQKLPEIKSNVQDVMFFC